MKALLIPLAKMLGIVLIFASVLWLLDEALNAPTWLKIFSSAVSVILVGIVGVQQNKTLLTYYHAVVAYLTNAPFLYELDTRITSSGEVGINTFITLLEDRYKNQATLGVRGANYLQIKLLEPPRTIEIKIQPDVSALAYQADDDIEDGPLSNAKIISIDFVDPVELRYRDVDGKTVYDTFNVLQDIANDIARVSKGQPPYFTVTINRVKKGVRPRHPEGPGPSGTVQDTADVRIRRDTKALQLQSSSSSAIVRHLTQGIAELEPIV